MCLQSWCLEWRKYFLHVNPLIFLIGARKYFLTKMNNFETFCNKYVMFVITSSLETIFPVNNITCRQYWTYYSLWTIRCRKRSPGYANCKTKLQHIISDFKARYLHITLLCGKYTWSEFKDTRLPSKWTPKIFLGSGKIILSSIFLNNINSFKRHTLLNDVPIVARKKILHESVIGHVIHVFKCAQSETKYTFI